MNNPCDGCRQRYDQCAAQFGQVFADSYNLACGPYARYLGYQEVIQECERWHTIVQECERILGCSDTASSALNSNLPNMVRDIVVERDRLKGEGIER